jgi:hypothetical protein
MDKRYAKELLFRLISARNEYEVKEIIDSEPFLLDLSSWKPYGGYEGNFNTINNQAKNPIAALAEKPINSIDALLLKECKLKGLDPESKNVPKTIKEAVETFYKIENGDISKIPDKDRKNFAINIMIIAEGDRKKPNIMIVDKGEGQHPSDFEDTFLSLHRGNKNRIPFVQGKYNMGGSGVLPNCGELNYQLILSRKTPELLNSNQDDKWGFTLVRLHIATKSEFKNSWYEYFVDESGEIMSFPGETLNILPENESLHSGTLIKLYNYYLPEQSIITLNLWRALNRVLHSPALPMLLYETRRFRLKGVNNSRVLMGNRIRILKDDRDSIEDGCPPIIPIIAELGRFGKRTIEVTVFKEETGKEEFSTPNDAVFFTINGQTHATIGRSFLRTKANLHYLADSLLVHIDCTDVETNIREKTFMPSRDRMRESEVSKEVEAILAEELSRHEGLKQLNQRRREEQIARNPRDTKFLEEVVSKLIKRNRLILNYFGYGGGIKDESEIGDLVFGQFEGKWIPTYLRIKGSQIKQVPIDSYARVIFETDAPNDYFSRERERGSLIMYPDIMKSYHLWNGRITVKLIPSKKAEVGDVKSVIVMLTRHEYEPLIVEFKVRYVEGKEQQSKESPVSLPSLTRIKDYKLPQPILVYKERREGCKTWDEVRREDGSAWNGEDIAKVVPSGDGRNVDIFINMDADVFHDFLNRQHLTQKKQEFIKKSWQSAIFLNALVIYNDLARIDMGNLLPDIMKSISKIVLDLMCNESLLKELEKDE